MDLAPDSPPVSSRPLTVRSKLANGSKLLPMTDGRSATARRFRDLVEAITADLGGRDRLSEGQRQLIRRASMLSAEAERLEAMAVRGEPFDSESYGMLTDRLGRALQRIGLRRVAREVPSLEQYLAEHSRGVEIENEADAS